MGRLHMQGRKGTHIPLFLGRSPTKLRLISGRGSPGRVAPFAAKQSRQGGRGKEGYLDSNISKGLKLLWGAQPTAYRKGYSYRVHPKAKRQKGGGLGKPYCPINRKEHNSYLWGKRGLRPRQKKKKKKKEKKIKKKRKDKKKKEKKKNKQKKKKKPHQQKILTSFEIFHRTTPSYRPPKEKKWREQSGSDEGDEGLECSGDRGAGVLAA